MVTDANSIPLSSGKGDLSGEVGASRPLLAGLFRSMFKPRGSILRRLPGFDASELDEPWKKTDLASAADGILEAVRNAKRPVIFAGNGVASLGRSRRTSFGLSKNSIYPWSRVGTPMMRFGTSTRLYCGRPRHRSADRGRQLHRTKRRSAAHSRLSSEHSPSQFTIGDLSRARATKIWIDIDAAGTSKAQRFRRYADTRGPCRSFARFSRGRPILAPPRRMPTG